LAEHGQEADTGAASVPLCSGGKAGPLVSGQGQVGGKLKPSSIPYAHPS